jgi:hypothetical protein
MTMYFDDCSRFEDADGFVLPAGIFKPKAPHVSEAAKDLGKAFLFLSEQTDGQVGAHSRWSTVDLCTILLARHLTAVSQLKLTLSIQTLKN